MIAKLHRIILHAGAAAGLAVAGLGSAVAAEWPTKPVTIMVPFDPGGSVDRLARSIATYMTKEVNQPVTVINRPGAGGQIGLTVALNMPDDGSSLIVTAPIPYTVNNILTGGANFSMDDFVHVNAQWIANGSFLINKDAPYQSMDELIVAMRDKPGQVSAGVIGQSSEHLTLLLMLDALKIPRENVRLVTYDGGGPTRTAVAGGQVDFGVLTAQGSEAILDRVRVAAMVSDRPIKGWDAPLLNTVLEAYGVKIPVLQSSVRSMVVARSFAEKHPDTYQAFLDAYRRTLERPDYQEFAAQSEIGIDWIGPEDSEKIVRESYDTLSKYSKLLDE